MARKPRVHFAGARYHVMSRGNQGQSIFKDDRDRECYLDFLKESQKRFGYRPFAYVLMGNHVHHLIQISHSPLSKVMQNILFRYTRYWNRRRPRNFGKRRRPSPIVVMTLALFRWDGSGLTINFRPTPDRRG